jgi:NAD-dependent SIR2 family protein deacetylase
MSIFGTSCVRCGASLPKKQEEGMPTCERCSSLLRSRLGREGEKTVQCPRDGAEMAKELIHEIVIDRCPVCGGVWLDPGELELIRHAAASGYRPGLVGTVVLGMTRD